jgi:release factor glutamine methyltransferase
MKTGALLRHIKDSLSITLGEYAIPQSEEILSFVTGLSRQNLYLSSNTDLSAEVVIKILDIVSRRLKGEPLPYILQTVFFYDREYFIDSSVLIPRPDTETLIEVILSGEPSTRARFIDIGTGSGIIVSTLTMHRPWKGIGIDISRDALRVAQRNNQSGYALCCADSLNAIKNTAQFDFIVSNPPYITEYEMQALDPEVRDYEPHTALLGGSDGLIFYRLFAERAGIFIKEGGNIYCEIGYTQSEQCSTLFEKHGWRDIRIHKDLGNNTRVLSARAPEHV